WAGTCRIPDVHGRALARYAVAAALVGAVASPVLRDPFDDGFPLSTYPMFAQRRGTRIDLDYAVGVKPDGSTVLLPSEVVGTGEVLQAAAIYEDAVHRGPAALGPLCKAIAAQVTWPSVRIVTGHHDAIALLVHGVRTREAIRWSCTK
ncbi:MAG TPA: hypothetical protein VGC41_24245, partial [Kofleriaceae bacterium]